MDLTSNSSLHNKFEQNHVKRVFWHRRRAKPQVCLCPEPSLFAHIPYETTVHLESMSMIVLLEIVINLGERHLNLQRKSNGYPDTRSVQENCNLITSFIQEPADKHIQSKTSRFLRFLELPRKKDERFAEQTKLLLKQKKTGSKKLRSKFETLRTEIGPGHAKTCLMPYANNKGADQPAYPRSLISTFVVRCLNSMICILAISKVSRF